MVCLLLQHYLLLQDKQVLGYETMVFACDKNGNVSDWSDLDSDNYQSKNDALIGHNKMVEKFQSK